MSIPFTHDEEIAKYKEKCVRMLGIDKWKTEDQSRVVTEWTSWVFAVQVVPGEQHTIRMEKFFKHLAKKYPEYKGRVNGQKFNF